MNKLTREECEQACLYLLSHCYEVEHNGKEKYTFTPSGFGEAEVFKNLIENHFNNSHLRLYDHTLNEIQALNALCDEDEMYKLAKGFSFDDYTSEYDYIKAKEYCKNVIQELIGNYAWIPVEERLPSPEKYVLVTRKEYLTGDCWIDILRRSEYGNWVCLLGTLAGNVIAWMPLPEAYGCRG